MHVLQDSLHRQWQPCLPASHAVYLPASVFLSKDITDPHTRNEEILFEAAKERSAA